jgi:sugar/nucleoside kinase (ribokinase family)
MSCVTRLGGIANIIRAIRAESDIRISAITSCENEHADELIKLRDVFILKETSQTATACIFETPSSKTSIVSWGTQFIPFCKNESGWNHISYLDKIDNIADCYKIGQIHSADLCTLSPSEGAIDAIPLVDYLVISEEEYRAIYHNNPNPKLPKLGLIVHSANGCRGIFNGNEYVFLNENLFKSIKVVGAGDTFAALFILSFMESGDAVQALKKCNEKTPELLLKLNK